MFLLNEIISSGNKAFHFEEVISLYDSNNKLNFKKGDLVYFDDFDLINLYSFFHLLKKNSDNYKDFINFEMLFNRHRKIFNYVNCIGEIKKISHTKIKLKRGTQLKKKYVIEITFPDGNSFKFNNIKNLRLYQKNNFFN